MVPPLKNSIDFNDPCKKSFFGKLHNPPPIRAQSLDLPKQGRLLTFTKRMRFTPHPFKCVTTGMSMHCCQNVFLHTARGFHGQNSPTKQKNLTTRNSHLLNVLHLHATDSCVFHIIVTDLSKGSVHTRTTNQYSTFT